MALHGLVVEFVIFGGNNTTSKSLPRHIRFYARETLLRRRGFAGRTTTNTVVGFSGAFERKARRNWLIPYYGLETGLWIPGNGGSYGQLTPVLGLHLYTHPYLFANLAGSAVLVPGAFDREGGWLISANISAALW